MVDAWPSSVPFDPIVESYTEAPERNVSEFAPEVGPPMTMRYVSIATTVIGFDIAGTMDEYDDLIDWYRDTLLDGSLPFTNTHPRPNLVGTYTFKFTDVPKFVAAGGDMGRISLAMRQLP